MNNTGRGRVLIVDDEEYVREIVSTMLDEMGFEVVLARDGFEGLDVFSDETGEFKACVVDLNMPGMAGLELLERIREQGSDVPVLLVSGYSRHEVRQKEAKLGNVSFLQKPFTKNQFQVALDGRLDAVG